MNIPHDTSGLNFFNGKPFINTEDTQMFAVKKKSTIGNPAQISSIITIVSFITMAAFASKNSVQNRKLTLEQAQNIAKNVQGESAFQITVNEQVVKQLNRYIATSQGREFIKKSLQRMETYRPMLELKINQYQVPKELLAIPMVESGYQNRLQDRRHKSWAAGLWMFIKSTAKAWGLRVTDRIDDRLNPELLTDAALRYLNANFLLFKDWELAILAYNLGETKVKNGIAKTGHKNAWKLIENGFENDRDYLAKVIATILILKNPNMIE